jgi:hypothetical protein
MERKNVRLLTEHELASLFEACGTIAKPRDMAHRVSDLARASAGDADSGLTDTLRFISGVLTPSIEVIPKIETAANPFWVTPSSLSDDEIALLKQIADASNDPELRSRCSDFVWLRTRDRKYGEAAADAYLESAIKLRHPEEWTTGAARYERATSVAASLGKKNPRYRQVIDSIEKYLVELDATDLLFMTCRLMEILLDQREGDRARYAALAEKAARAAEARKNFYVAQFHWDLAQKWYLAKEDSEGARSMRIAAAETAVKDAASRTEGESASFLVAASILQGAIAMMQKAGAPAERIKELFIQLKKYEAEGVPELKPINIGSIDLSDVADLARRDVAGKSLADSLRALADMVRLPNREEVKAEVLKNAKDYPLSHSFGEELLDSEGAAIAGRGAIGGEEETETDGVLSVMYENVIRTFSYMALGQIDPGRRQILDEHDARAIDFAIIAQRSWFVPPGRDVLFSRGLHAGLHGDFPVALHLLVPQIEAALRWNFRRRGEVTTKLNRDGYQEEMDLNQLLATATARDLLGEDLRFALQALLTSRFGFNLRNKLAHGLLDVGTMHSTVSEFFWALVLMICVRAISPAPTSGDAG